MVEPIVRAESLHLWLRFFIPFDPKNIHLLRPLDCRSINSLLLSLKPPQPPTSQPSIFTHFSTNFFPSYFLHLIPKSSLNFSFLTFFLSHSTHLHTQTFDNSTIPFILPNLSQIHPYFFPIHLNFYKFSIFFHFPSPLHFIQCLEVSLVYSSLPWHPRRRQGQFKT